MKRSTILMWSLSLFLLGNGLVHAARENRNPTKNLYVAAMDGDLEQIKVHIDRGTDLNKPDQRGSAPLAHAAELGHPDAVKMLLDAGATIDIQDSNGKTPLMRAAQRGHTAVVELLLSRSAKVDAKDSFQMTALHVAAQWGYKDIVEALVEAGADMNAEDNRRQTPLSTAQQRRHTEVVEFLKAKGAKEPVIADGRYGPYGPEYSDYGSMQAATPQAPSAFAGTVQRVDILSDPNAIREKIKSFQGLETALKAIDANSLSEQRGWVQRRIDNRTSLVRAVEKQFVEEMTFVKKTAEKEKAKETVQVIDDLAARRKTRFKLIGDDLRAERRAMLQSQRASGRGRGRTGGRGARGGYTSDMGAQGASGAYGNYGARTPGDNRPAQSNEPPIDQETQSQIQAWRSATPENKDTLLRAVHELDLAEFGLLHQVAVEEEAKQTTAAIEALMLARQERVRNIEQKWQLEDERLRRIEERNQQRGGRGRGMRGGVPGQQNQTTQPGRRYR